MKRSGIVMLALSGVLTLVALVLGDFRLFVKLQWYYLVGFLLVVLIALLNTRHELASSTGRDRFFLRFVQGLAACAVCFGLVVTIIGLLQTAWCARHLRVSPGDIVVSFLPLLYCLTIAEVVCPALSHRLGCRIDRAEQAASEPEPKANQ